ncbi:MAG: adenylate/guanylate cyclase domain-containing protein [Geminicoccaceae bacterium]
MADTARFNEAAKLPRQTIEERTEPDGGIAFVGRAKIGPLALVWDDLPCNWVAERWFEHTRLFHNGPLRRITARFSLEDDGAGCRGTYALTAEPSGLLGRALLAGPFFPNFGKTLRRLAAEADRFAVGEREGAFEVAPPTLAAGAEARLERIRAELAASPYAHGLGDRLILHVRSASDNDALKIRPLALAKLWGVPERQAVELCLIATRLGLLALRWDLLCPRCRIAKSVSTGLDELPKGAHCGTCNIDYGRDFSANVELSFRPAEAVRQVAAGEFCLFGPMSMPHVWAHITLAPGETRELEELPDPGPYRLRTLEIGPEADIKFDGGVFPSVLLTADGIEAGSPSPSGVVRLVNDSAVQRTAVIEERRWVEEALLADRMTALQAFRDLFSEQVLRPGDEVGIDRVTLLFSDLRGSTALYGAIGDAGAYHLVREHFAFLARCVREHDGAIVKTIGDAVMAAFKDPASGLAAALAMQDGIAAFNAAQGSGIVLKLGLHEGPCIAVTLNDRLDYFGSTVNLAARLQGESQGSDIVLSTSLAADPEVRTRLVGRTTRSGTADLKGFAQPIPFLRAVV